MIARVTVVNAHPDPPGAGTPLFGRVPYRGCLPRISGAPEVGRVYYAGVWEENDRDDDPTLSTFVRPEPAMGQ